MISFFASSLWTDAHGVFVSLPTSWWRRALSDWLKVDHVVLQHMARPKSACGIVSADAHATDASRPIRKKDDSSDFGAA